MHRNLVVLLLAACVAAPLEAQRLPQRPRLPAAADTNDAIAYFQHGLDNIERDPAAADAAFYWASRLDPMSPQSLYARGVAQLLRDPRRLVRYLQRESRTMGLGAVRTIDSLRFRAEMQDPFLHRGLDELLLFTWAKNASRSEDWFGTSSSAGAGAVSGQRTASNASGITGSTERFLEETDQYSRGRLYYSQGDLRNALLYFALANRGQEVDWLYAERARAFMELRQLDSALSALTSALRLRRGPNDDWNRPVFESQAAWQFAYGRILEDRRDTASARAAYEHAIVADPNYYPALLRLGVLALTQRDTAGAVGVLRRVIDRPDVQYFALAVSATLLDRIGRREVAIEALRKATTMEPQASAGWLMLARALESGADTTGAVNAYRRYLVIAPRADAQRTSATAAIGRLGGSLP